MLDDSDLDWFSLASLFTKGWFSVALFVAAVVIAVVVWSNHDDCSKMRCPEGQRPLLAVHECLCVTKAEPANR